MDEKIYKEHAQLVYHFLLTQCHNDHLAEELTQETFLRAYQSLERYNGTCKLSVWLCQIAKHVWYQYVDKHKREIITDFAEESIIDNSSLEEHVISKLDLKEMLKELHKLPEEMREVIYLRMTSELSFRDIGEIVGKSENWARVTYFRGKEKIMKGMKKYETDSM